MQLDLFESPERSRQIHIQKVMKMAEALPPDSRECPVARSLEVIGDRWSLMIIRDAFDGIRRFSEFQKGLGVAKNILTSRLKALVEVEVFEIRPASDGSAYKEYVLTEKGRAIFPIVVSLRQWGERFQFEPHEPRSVLLDNASGQPVAALVVRSAGGEVLEPSDCHRVRRGGGEA
jgi:DNA-binding HxlR family transcriptional regulator